MIPAIFRSGLLITKFMIPRQPIEWPWRKQGISSRTSFSIEWIWWWCSWILKWPTRSPLLIPWPFMSIKCTSNPFRAWLIPTSKKLSLFSEFPCIRQIVAFWANFWGSALLPLTILVCRVKEASYILACLIYFLVNRISPPSSMVISVGVCTLSIKWSSSS